jgi:thioredoxin reductase (NADPH)
VLRERHSQLSVELHDVIGDPGSAKARTIIEEQKAITKIIHHHHRDTGLPIDLGKTGPPHDVVIIGAGPGGLGAAIYGASEGLDTLLVDAGPDPGGQIAMSSRVENYPGFPAGVVGRQYAQDSFDQASRLGAYIEMETRVSGIDYDPDTGLKTVRYTDGRSVTARSVIIAGGVTLRTLDRPGFSGNPDVVYGDSRTIKERAQGKPVVFIGAGNSSGQAALDVAASGSKVTILVRGSTLAASMSDYLVRQVQGHPNIEVRTNTELTSVIRGSDGRTKAARLSDGSTLPTSAVGVFIGANPNTEWAPVEIDERGYIVTGKDGREPLETSMPGVFAAGDNRAGATKRVAQASAEGQMAVSYAHTHLERMATEFLYERDRERPAAQVA